MFDTKAFLAAVLKRAGSQAEIVRTLDIPSSHVSLLFVPDKHGKLRRLKLEEAVALAERFRIPLHSPMINASLLKPILQVALRYGPKGAWKDQDVERLAQALEYGLGLLRSVAPNQPSQDAIDVAAHAIADRLRDGPDPEAPAS